MTLQELNTLGDASLRPLLKQCCGSDAWVDHMIEIRPFADETSLFYAADDLWCSLAPADWLQAFAQHPKIGEKSTAKWSSEEQRGMNDAASGVAATMHELNLDYQRKFGYIFIVCATGKTAEEMLQLLTSRINNDPANELSIAAAEQAKITRLRLEKLLTE